MKNKYVVFKIPFNNIKKTPDRITKDWITTRMTIFFKTTFKSLKCQTNQNFEAFVLCDPDSLNTIHEVLNDHEQLPGNVHFVDVNLVAALINKVGESYEFIYLTSTDSDNMYSKDFVQKLYDIQPKPDTEALLCQNGYIWNINSNELAYYLHASSSNYALIYKSSEYKHGKRYVVGSHKKIITDFKVELLNDYFYMVTINGANALFAPKDMRWKIMIEGEMKTAILQKFGVSE